MQAHAQLLDPANYESIESDLTWLGVAGLLDPPRPEVRGAIADCVLAGIRVSICRHATSCPANPRAIAIQGAHAHEDGDASTNDAQSTWCYVQSLFVHDSTKCLAIVWMLLVYPSR